MEIQDKVNRASGRAIVGIGVAVAIETKLVTHVISGTLRRSVHAAPEGYEVEFGRYGAGDEEMAQQGDLMMIYGPPSPTPTPFGPVIEVGSWLPYACAEWVGRGHPGVTQGLEMVRGRRADLIVAQAFREEGL